MSTSTSGSFLQRKPPRTLLQSTLTRVSFESWYRARMIPQWLKCGAGLLTGCSVGFQTHASLRVLTRSRRLNTSWAMESILPYPAIFYTARCCDRHITSSLRASLSFGSLQAYTHAGLRVRNRLWTAPLRRRTQVNSHA